MKGVRSRLEQYGLAPSKARGQNFLRSEQTAERIVNKLGLEPGDAAVEIGPGLGDLTRAIAGVARRTVALEVDRGLVSLLAEAELPASVEVRHEDAMDADLGGLARELGQPVVLIGNLPYSMAGRFLGTLLGPRNPFRRWGFMVQSEVGERLTASPGGPGYGPLAVWAGLWTEARTVLELGPDAFVPRPRVRSSFLVFDPAPEPPEIRDLRVLREVVRAAFQHRRKTLRAALRGRVEGAEHALEAIGVDPQRRGETLSQLEFVRLANEIAASRSPG
jgi:16S rRNA (adenine1518-N6/adenine1519-N6)-dimethyltransferase